MKIPAIKKDIVMSESSGKVYEYYAFSYKGTKYRFHTLEEAEAKAKELVDTYHNSEAYTRAEIKRIYGDAIMASAYALHRKFPEEDIGLLMARAVDQFVRTEGSADTSSTTREAIDRYVTSPEFCKLAKKTKDGMLQAIELFVAFAKIDEEPVCSVNHKQIEDYFAQMANTSAPATYNSHRRRLKTFFNWAYNKRYDIDPRLLAGVPALPIPAQEPEHIDCESMDRLIDGLWIRCRDSESEDKRRTSCAALAFVALSYFAGLRTVEVSGVSSGDIHLDTERPYVRVSITKGTTRGRHGRMVPLEPSACSTLNACIKMCPDVLDEMSYHLRSTGKGEHLYAIIDEVFSEMGRERTLNLGRHSYITHHVAKYHDEGYTVTCAGTSRDMAATHYRGLVTETDGDIYFRGRIFE